MAKPQENPEIRDFILRTIPAHPSAVSAMTTERFGVSRMAVSRYVKKLEAEGLIASSGKTNARTYTLLPIVDILETLPVSPSMQESEVWVRRFRPHVSMLRENVLNICDYGFGEMLNNVIDHSGSPDVTLSLKIDYVGVRLVISDRGVGIFEKIKSDFGLVDSRQALLELSKGKLTSDRARHSGEGIFFTSRMFQKFGILSGNLYYSRSRDQGGDDWGWLIETRDESKFSTGTTIFMDVPTSANWTPKIVFDRFQDEDMQFSKTHVPITLARYAEEQLLSRSQAKRVLARFDRFEEVMLDFQGVPDIGPAFADEIFRVYARMNPKVEIIAINTSPDVQRMIDRAKKSNPTAPGDAF